MPHRLAVRRLPAILVVALVVLVLGAASAVAATIDVSPATVDTGGQVTVSGDVLANGSPGCTVPGDVTLISPAWGGGGGVGGPPPPHPPPPPPRAMWTTGTN